MPVLPTDLTFSNSISGLLMRASNWVGSMFASRDFHSGYALDTVPLIDERLRPRAPMPKDDIEILTRINLSNIGLRNAQLVTAESHPELHEAWTILCRRAGYGNKVPQLIMTESNIVNAMEITPNEMVITSGLLKMLTLREVVAVLGHELGHGRHEHTAVRLAAMGTFGAAGAIVGNEVGRIVQNPTGPSPTLNSLGAVGRWVEKHFFPPQTTPRPTSALEYLMYIGAELFVGNIAAAQISVKPTELQADLDGVAISGDPQAMASALSKMHATDKRHPLTKWFGYLRSGYPTLEERVDNIARASREIPANPIPVALAPIPAMPRPQVHSITNAARVEMQEPAAGVQV